MIVVGVVSALLIIATTLKVKERPEFTRVDKPLPLGPAIRFTFTSRSFLILVAANFMSILMQSLLLGTLFYLADYVLQMNSMIVLAAVFIPLIIGVPVSNLIRARLGVVRAQQLLLVIGGVALILLTVVPGPLILVCLALAGFGLAGPQTLTNVLFAQVVDEDELRSGVRREGAFFGVNALITKPAQSVALALMPFILEATGFITRGSNGGQITLDQPAGALFGIRSLMGLIPGAAMILGALILLAYPLRGKYLAKVQSEGAGAARGQARTVGSAVKPPVKRKNHMPPTFLLYGATGYTGSLTARTAVQLGLKPILAGRNPVKVKALAENWVSNGAPFRWRTARRSTWRCARCPSCSTARGRIRAPTSRWSTPACAPARTTWTSPAS